MIAFTRSASRIPRWHGRKQLTGWGGGRGAVVVFTRSASRIPHWHGRKQLMGWGGGVSSFLSAVQFVGGNHFNALDSKLPVLPVVFSLGLSVILCMDLRRWVLTFAHMPQMAGISQETQCLLACVSLPPLLACWQQEPVETVDALHELFSASSRNDAVSSIVRAAAQAQHDFQSLKALSA